MTSNNSNIDTSPNLSVRELVSFYNTLNNLSELKGDLGRSSVTTIQKKITGAFSPLSMYETISHYRANGMGSRKEILYQTALSGVRVMFVPVNLLTNSYNYLVGTVSSSISRKISSVFESWSPYNNAKKTLAAKIQGYVFNRPEDKSAIPHLRQKLDGVKESYNGLMQKIVPGYGSETRTFGDYLLSDLQDLMTATQVLRIYINNEDEIVKAIQDKANELWIQPLQDYLEKRGGAESTQISKTLSATIIAFLYGVIQKTHYADFASTIEMKNLVPTLDKLVNTRLPQESSKMTERIKRTFERNCEAVIRGVSATVINSAVKLGVHAAFWKATELAAEVIDEQCSAESVEDVSSSSLCDYAPTNLTKKQLSFYAALTVISLTQSYFAMMKWREKRGNHDTHVDKNIKTVEKMFGDAQKILEPLKEYFWDKEFSDIYHKGRNEFFGEALQGIIDQQINAKIV